MPPTEIAGGKVSEMQMALEQLDVSLQDSDIEFDVSSVFTMHEFKQAEGKVIAHLTVEVETKDSSSGLGGIGDKIGDAVGGSVGDAIGDVAEDLPIDITIDGNTATIKILEFSYSGGGGGGGSSSGNGGSGGGESSGSGGGSSGGGSGGGGSSGGGSGGGGSSGGGSGGGGGSKSKSASSGGSGGSSKSTGGSSGSSGSKSGAKSDGSKRGGKSGNGSKSGGKSGSSKSEDDGNNISGSFEKEFDGYEFTVNYQYVRKPGEEYTEGTHDLDASGVIPLPEVALEAPVEDLNEAGNAVIEKYREILAEFEKDEPDSGLVRSLKGLGLVPPDEIAGANVSEMEMALEQLDVTLEDSEIEFDVNTVFTMHEFKETSGTVVAYLVVAVETEDSSSGLGGIGGAIGDAVGGSVGDVVGDVADDLDIDIEIDGNEAKIEIVEF